MLNIDAAKSLRWRSPNRWDKYKEPYANLIYALLLRAAADSNGYMDDKKRKREGTEAILFLAGDGSDYFEYLKECEKAPVTVHAEKMRKQKVFHVKHKYEAAPEYEQCDNCDFDGVCSISCARCMGIEKCRNTPYIE